MRAVISGSGIISAARALALACALLLHAGPVPALAGPAGAGHEERRGDADKARSFVLSAEETIFGTALPGDGLLVMGGKHHESAPTGEETAMAGNNEDSAGSLFDSVFQGSFVGALVFGYPYQELGIVDLAALALIGFLVVWRFMPAPRKSPERKDDSFTADRRKGPPGQRDNGRTTPDASGLPNRDGPRPDSPRSDKAGGASGRWPVRGRAEQQARQPGGQPDGQRDGPERGWGTVASEAAPEPLIASRSASPAEDFDSDDFLEGARVLYIRMQEAWAARDTESLAPFMTPDMMRLLHERAAADPHPADVDILLLNAVLLGQEGRGGEERADVEFSVLMRTDGDVPVEIHEMWRFVRGRDTDGMWRLAGIEPRGERQ